MSDRIPQHVGEKRQSDWEEYAEDFNNRFTMHGDKAAEYAFVSGWMKGYEFRKRKTGKEPTHAADTEG